MNYYMVHTNWCCMYVLCNVFFVLSTSIANFQIKHLSTLFFITSNYANYELLNSSNRIDLNYRSEYGENLKLDQTNNFTSKMMYN